jgi:hypothetical protein
LEIGRRGAYLNLKEIRGGLEELEVALVELVVRLRGVRGEADTWESRGARR